MHFSNLLALGAATFAAAAPSAQAPVHNVNPNGLVLRRGNPNFTLRCLDSPDLKCPPPGDDGAPGVFNVTNFAFGCTSTCNFLLYVSVEGINFPNHPGIDTPLYIYGDFHKQEYYGNRTAGGEIQAYVESAANNKNILRLKYLYTTPPDEQGGYNVYEYRGETEVVAFSNEPNFRVGETEVSTVYIL